MYEIYGYVYMGNYVLGLLCYLLISFLKNIWFEKVYVFDLRLNV